MGSFFEICIRYRVVDLVQITKGYDYSMIRKIPVMQFRKFLENVLEDRKQELIYRLYLALLPNMTKETFVSFDDFYAQTIIDQRPEAEIVEELDMIETKFKEKGGPDGTIQTVR